MREPCFAHQSDGHDASRHPHVDPRILQFLRRLFRVARKNLKNGVSKGVLGGIGLLPKCLDLLQLVAPQFVNLLVECQWVPLLRGDRESIINKLLTRVLEASGTRRYYSWFESLGNRTRKRPDAAKLRTHLHIHRRG